MALKDADGQRQGGVHRQDTQELFRQGDLLRRELGAEDHIAVGKPEADDQQGRTQEQVGDEEHAVELGHALLILRHPASGVVANIGAAQAEAHQVQVGDDGQNRLIDAEFAGAQPLEHDGGIDQGDEGGEPHGHIGQKGTGPYLIDLYGSSPLLFQKIYSMLLYPISTVK